MSIVALFTIAKIWKKLNCPLIDKWIKKMWYIYTMEYYSAIKNNEIMPFAATQMQLEIIILQKVKKKKRQIPCNISYMWNLKYNTNEHTYQQKQTLKYRGQTVVAKEE